jgi:hypothetical protein
MVNAHQRTFFCGSGFQGGGARWREGCQIVVRLSRDKRGAVTTPDPRDHVYKPPRIVGEVPADYEGPVFYRIANVSSPSASFGFKGWSNAEKLIWERLPNIAYLGELGLEPGRILDEQGQLLPEFAEPIKAKVDTRRKSADWELRTYPPLVSDRVKEIIDEFEPGKAVFIPIDAAWPDGRIDRYYWAVWGKLMGRATDDITPPQWFHSGDREFHYLSAAKVAGRHFIWGGSYTVLSGEIMRRFGDVLLRQQVLVPCGVAAQSIEDPALRQSYPGRRPDKPAGQGWKAWLIIGGVIVIAFLATLV